MLSLRKYKITCKYCTLDTKYFHLYFFCIYLFNYFPFCAPPTDTKFFYFFTLTFKCNFKLPNPTILILILLLSGDVELNPGPNINVSLVHLNVRSLCHQDKHNNKLDLITAELSSDFDFILLTETWLDRHAPSDTLSIQNFHPPIRKDRDGRGGGVALYIRNSFFFKRRHDLETDNTEGIWIEAEINRTKFLIGTYYLAPKPDNGVRNSFSNSIYLAACDNIENMFIFGDFNVNFLTKSNSFIHDIMNMLDLEQVITEPTRYDASGSKSLLDLILTNCSRYISESGTLDNFCSDHCPVYCRLSLKRANFSSFKRLIWQYDKADMDGLRRDILGTDWGSLIDECDINSSTTSFTAELMKIATKNIPNKSVTIRPRDKLWMNNTIRHMSRRKNKIHRKAVRSNSENDWRNFRLIRNEYISLIRNCKNEYYKKLDEKINENQSFGSKQWFNYINSYVKGQSGYSQLPTLIKDGISAFTSVDKANCLNNFFISQSQLDTINAQLPLLPQNPNSLNHIKLTPQEVKDMILTLDTSKANGPDNINAKLLKPFSDELSTPLCSLFNLSLSLNSVPSLWKSANVTAIFKKDDPTNPSNYRPISLLSLIAKILEKCIYKHVFNFLRQNSILTEFQSGFLHGHSTVYQLISLSHFFCQAIDQGQYTRAVFCDISKAFDRVWHAGLCQKLQAVGIRGGLLIWFKDYLNNRSQRVVVSGASSDSLTIPAGVPQGSVLGPLLFLIYINDITTNIKSNIRLFADDTSLYLRVDDPTECAAVLNRDLETINTWAKTWMVTFNPQKTETLALTTKHNPLLPTLSLDDVPIKEFPFHKHLGLTFQKNCKWDIHINEISTKIGRLVNCLRSLKYRLNRKSLQTIYTSYILPHFDYCDVIWDGCTDELANSLEHLQLDALRSICGAVRGTSHDLLYLETGFVPLKERRRRHKLILIYKILHNLTPPFLSDLINLTVPSSYNLRSQPPLSEYYCRTNIFSNSCIPSAIRLWNNCPRHLASSDSLSIFKTRLSSNDPSIPPTYYIGTRKNQILHSRLRLSCSDLNGHKFLRHVSDNPACDCGHQFEDTEHYLLHCSLHLDARNHSVNLLPSHLKNLHSLLYGSSVPTESISIFNQVHSFLSLSKRFNIFS